MVGRVRLPDESVGGKKAGGVAGCGKKKLLEFPKTSPCLA